MELFRLCIHGLGVAILLALVASFAGAEEYQGAKATARELAMLKTLKTDHPRVLITDADIERVRSLLKTDKAVRKMRDVVFKQAQDVLSQEPVEHVLIGPRLLTQSRRAVSRVTTLGVAYRLTGERKYAERARTEMLTAAAFPDWNPSHFLDTAEMTNALAIGYDCFYRDLSPADRSTISKAIVRLGLLPGLSIYEKQTGWAVDAFNWNQVCNGGMLSGALAIADEEPDLAARIVSFAVKALPFAMNTYEPDGAWPEGPGYWAYATSYSVYALAALQNSLGTDFGLGQARGLIESGMFRFHSTGPLGLTFNFADSAEIIGRAPDLFWMSRRFDRPLYAWLERHHFRDPNALDLLWYDPRGSGPKADRVPLDAHFTAAGVVFMRSAWEDSDALYVGFKGGDNTVNHSHLDLGTFVLDALGQRWVAELGPDDYNLPGYWDTANRRWSYYRLGTPGQNTLVLDNQNQKYHARAPVTAFSPDSESPFAIADLSEGYVPVASSVRRGVAMPGRRSVVIQDEIRAPEPIEVSWRVHTRASVTVAGRTATMTQEGRTLEARLLEPADASFAVESAAQEPPQNRNEGVLRLMVKLPGKVTQTRIVVQFAPMTKGKRALDYHVKSLSEWKPGGM